MTRSRTRGLRDRLFSGVHPGLPTPVQRVPFGLESRSKALIGLTESQLQVVVAVVAAEYVQLGPVSLREINEVVDCSANASLHKLVLWGWLEEQTGQVKARTTKLYIATPKAWRELGLQGWSLLKEVA